MGTRSARHPPRRSRTHPRRRQRATSSQPQAARVSSAFPWMYAMAHPRHERDARVRTRAHPPPPDRSASPAQPALQPCRRRARLDRQPPSRPLRRLPLDPSRPSQSRRPARRRRPVSRRLCPRTRISRERSRGTAPTSQASGTPCETSVWSWSTMPSLRTATSVSALDGRPGPNASAGLTWPDACSVACSQERLARKGEGGREGLLYKLREQDGQQLPTESVLCPRRMRLES